MNATMNADQEGKKLASAENEQHGLADDCACVGKDFVGIKPRISCSLRCNPDSFGFISAKGTSLEELNV